MDFNPYTFATPLLLGMNALLCGGFYRFYRRQPHLLWIAGFMVLLALGLSTQLLMNAAQRYQYVLWTSGLYLAAVTCLAQSLALRLQRPIQWWGIACLAALTLAGMWYFSAKQPDMRVRMTLLSVGAALIKTQTLFHLRDARPRHTLDHLSIALYALMLAALLVRPLLLLISDSGMQSDTVSDHASWMFTSISAMVLCTLLTLSLCTSVLADTNLQLRHERNQDALTGLLNRRAFEELCAPVPHARGIRTLLVCDLDHFKRINDRHGHLAGDAVLQAFGHILRTQVRERDVVARLGGEEFVLALHATTLAQAQQLASRLAQTLQDYRWQHPQLPADFQLTASMGIVQVQPGEGLTQALQRVDALLYAAKRAGRNRIHSDPLLPAA